MNKIITSIKNDNGRVKWNTLVGKEVEVEYKDKRYIVTITSYDVKKRSIDIKYKDKTTSINISSFLNEHFGKILNIRTNEFRYNISDIVDTNTGKVEILKRYKDEDKRKIYNYKCYKCHCINDMSESWLINGNSCPVCGNKKVVKGINDIATTHPYLVKYFKNINDSTKYTYSSMKEIEVCCPDCGFDSKTTSDRLYRQGFSCKRCGDGISFGEKAIFCILEQLDIIFTTQLSRKILNWCDKYKYDFYIPSLGIIEVHGKQHYQEAFEKIKTDKNVMTLREVQANDKLKKELALDNGVKEENYIVINCRESNLEYIKTNIMNSRLKDIFDLSVIDWRKIQGYTNSSLVKKACEYKSYNPNLSANDICNIMKYSDTTIRKWLKQGNDLGWCVYDAKIETEKGRAKGRYNKRKQLICVNNGKIFNSVKECAYNSMEVFGIELIESGISAVCRGEQPSYKNLVFQYI